MALDEANGNVYAQNGLFASNLVVVNASAEKVLSPIPLGSNVSTAEPVGLAVDAVADRVYLADWVSGNVTVIDGATDTVQRTIDLGCSFRSRACNLEAVATDPSSNLLFVDTVAPSYQGPGNLTLFNSSTLQVLGTLPVGASALLADGRHDLYAANSYNGTVAVLDERSLTVERWLNLGPSVIPQPMALDPRTGDVFVAGFRGPPRFAQLGVTVLRGASIMSSTTFPVPGFLASSIVFDPSNRLLYLGGCCDADGNNLVVANASTFQVLGTLPSAGIPEVLAVSPENGSVWADTSFGILDVYSSGPPASSTPSIWSEVLGEPNALYAFLGMAVGALLVAAGGREMWAGRVGGEHRVPRWVLAAERAEERARRTRMERTSTWFWIGVAGLVVIALLVLIAR